jgi:ankyrin repeat protein
MVNPKNGRTALHYAVLRERGCEEIIKILLMNGAEINKVDKDKMTALQLAVIKEDINIVAALLAKNADPNIVNRFGRTALFYANIKEIEAMLLAAGAKK